MGVEYTVYEAYDNYIDNAGNGEIVAPEDWIDSVKERLLQNFSALSKGRSHAHIRDEILASAQFDMCLYCGVATADTIDHVLPQQVYPEFTVLAQNLVPACGRCNREKGVICSASNGMTLMHPYFTDVPGEKMLHVDVVVGDDDINWEYSVVQLPGMDGDAFRAIENLFGALKLKEVYGAVSLMEVSERAKSIGLQFDIGGERQVKDYLLSEAESVRAQRGDNYWKTAILVALADCGEFCAEGFKLFTKAV